MFSDVSMDEIALFPIPNCVAFPKTVFPLHVFEPRYRNMVRYCIEHNFLMGICHTQKILHPGKKGQPPEDALHSNQATYKPYEIFSAGKCELTETLEDGRMRVSVHIENRFKLTEEIQTLPFSIYRCKAVYDKTSTEFEAKQAEITKQKVLKRLTAITADLPSVQRLLSSDKWRLKKADVFSFEVFGVLRLDPDIQQSILELRTPHDRLEKVLSVLNNTPP